MDLEWYALPPHNCLRHNPIIGARYLSINKFVIFIDREITTDSLQSLINQTFEIWGPKKRVNFPAFLAKQIVARERRPELPILRGIIHSLLLTKTGEVITEPGYHEGTGCLLTFNPGELLDHNQSLSNLEVIPNCSCYPYSRPN